ncbi:MAG: glycerol-3-phosphate dehydrogenase C-terminal domain-containing protein [Acidimicrobiales bacterium]
MESVADEPVIDHHTDRSTKERQPGSRGSTAQGTSRGWAAFVRACPLIAGAEDETTKLSREHAVNRPEPGLLLVSGGKYTTYRLMAKDTVDAAVDHGGLLAGPCVTARLPIAGAGGFRGAWQDRQRMAAGYGLPLSQMERLLHRYGALVPAVLAGSPPGGRPLSPLEGAEGYLRSEVAYAVTDEDARQLAADLEAEMLAEDSAGNATVTAVEPLLPLP